MLKRKPSRTQIRDEKNKNRKKYCFTKKCFAILPLIMVVLMAVASLLFQLDQNRNDEAFSQEMMKALFQGDKTSETLDIDITTNLRGDDTKPGEKKTGLETDFSIHPASVSSKASSGRFAYAFLVAGIKPEDPSYRGYIYNIAIAKEILSKHNSTADVVVMVRMHADSNQTALPPEDEIILTKTGVKIQYIPKPLTDNFHTAMMDKFRILEMTEYDRVIYLDSDVMPVANLDYVFENSMGHDATLQPNVVLAYHLEPSNGGFFMLQPNKDDYHLLSTIVERRENEGYDFNKTYGWGHVITPPDYWEGFNDKGTEWSFYGAFTDQGLLYHWVKYVKKQVTIIHGRNIQTFLPNPDTNQVEMVKSVDSRTIFGDIIQQSLNNTHYVRPVHRAGRNTDYAVPYMHYHHFVGKTKPWRNPKVAHNPPKHRDVPNSPVHLWFNTLREIEERYSVGINTKNVWVGEATLGNFPANSMVMWAKEAREKEQQERNQQQQEQNDQPNSEVNSSINTNVSITMITEKIQSLQQKRFAYAFLVAGVKPEDPTHKGYIYNIVISKDILKQRNSIADVVIMIRMHKDTNHTALAPEEEAILTRSGIIVKYIPKPIIDNFHTAMMDKFRILEMTEYDRVLYLDSDVMPLNNLDYVFENSIGPNATLEENVVLAYHHEPSNGGFFMLSPKEGDYIELTKIIHEREKYGYNFNETIGWGHVITPPDYWESAKDQGTTWTFYGAFTDQVRVQQYYSC
jgi:alpha-N-acetylglucosamine transferase